jgi:hypothetical protein
VDFKGELCALFPSTCFKKRTPNPIARQLATKAGVTSNTVVDMNQSLIDDALVDKEKIGGSNYFWSFPAKKDHQMQLKHTETLELIEKIKTTATDANAQLVDAKRGREDESGERAQKLRRLHEIATERTKLEKELGVLKENDPQAMADLHHELKLVQSAACRWTDNIFMCKDYLTKKRGMDKKEAMKVLQITGNFDYPEDKIPK